MAAPALVLAVIAGSALAGDYELDWYTIDGGGVMSASGGDFELDATAGQHDAGPAAMTGGAFELAGGFWMVAGGAQICAQPGDMNLDGDIDGDDVQLFVDCLLGGGGTNCACADLDGGGVDVGDVALFVSALLSN